MSPCCDFGFAVAAVEGSPLSDICGLLVAFTEEGLGVFDLVVCFMLDLDV